MIKSVTLQHVASFGKYSFDLRKVNFLYGTNGTGKTTFSRYLQQMTAGQVLPPYYQCQLQWDDEGTMPIFVYNKDFKERNIGESINGVFTIGAKAKDEDNQLKDLQSGMDSAKVQIDTSVDQLGQLSKDKEQAISDYRKELWEIRGQYKAELEGFMGAKHGPANSRTGTKDTFTRTMEYYYNEVFNKAKPTPLSWNELMQEDKVLRGECPARLLERMLPDGVEALRAIERDNLWQRPIVGKDDIDLAALMQQLGNSDWVRQGHRHYLDAASGVCPFCQQPIQLDVLKGQIEDYFDQAYENQINTLKETAARYRDLAARWIQALRSLREMELQTALSKFDAARFLNLIMALEAHVNSNLQQFAAKVRQPSTSVEVAYIDALLPDLQAFFANANAAILQHNQLCANYAQRQEECKLHIAAYLIAQAFDTMRGFEENMRRLEDAVKNIGKRIEQLNEEWKDLNDNYQKVKANMSEVAPTAAAINRDLKANGFHGFELVPLGNRYTIVRPGNEPAANTLSEGEVSLLTFLYFMHQVNGGATAEEVAQPRIVVIDDPISSVDSEVLSVISTQVRNLVTQVLKDQSHVQQVIILTHNVQFHKQVSYKLNNISSTPAAICYWLLSKGKPSPDGRAQTWVTYHKGFNPVKSHYQLLWMQLLNMKCYYDSPDHRDQHNILLCKPYTENIQNTMRSICEAYFKNIGGIEPAKIAEDYREENGSSDLEDLVQWMNVGSHAPADGYDICQEMSPAVFETRLEQFKRLFSFKGQLAHYEMMMQEAQSASEMDDE